MIWQSKTVAAGLVLARGGPALAAEPRAEVRDLRYRNGAVHVVAYTGADFLRPTRSHSVSASSGLVTLADVPPGTQAVQMVDGDHDRRALNRSGTLLTKETGFPHDALMRFDPPAWGNAAFNPGEPGAPVRLGKRYIQ